MNDKKKFWLYNIKILWKDYGIPFVPNNNMTPIEKLNAIARFTIIFSMCIILIDGNNKWIALSLMVLLSTIIIFYKLNNFKLLSKEECRKSTINNPFMNFILGDLYNNTEELSACEDEDNINNNFKHNIYQDVTDLNDNQISDRQFITFSSTKSVNDQKGFAEWLYSDSGKCKSTGQECLKVKDNRYHNSRYYR